MEGKEEDDQNIFIKFLWLSSSRSGGLAIVVEDQEAVHREEEDDHNRIDHIFVVIILRRPCMEGVKIEEREGKGQGLIACRSQSLS